MPVVSPPTAPHIVVMIPEKSDPLELFAAWYAEAEKSEPNDPSALSLATVGPDGTPAVRMVLLKGFDASGFVFYTNHESRKGKHLLAHPKAAMLFHWKSLRRQVRLEGPVAPTTAEEADAYFASRDRGSQIGAWASDQSRPLESRFTPFSYFCTCWNETPRACANSSWLILFIFLRARIRAPTWMSNAPAPRVLCIACPVLDFFMGNTPSRYA